MTQEPLLDRPDEPNAEVWRSLGPWPGWRQMGTAGLHWARRKIVDPLVGYLRQGMEPRVLALSASMGLAFGLFPIAGLTSVCCGVAAVVLRGRCHVPTMLLVNMVVTPLELSLIIPFMRLGERVLGAPALPLDPSAFWDFITGHGSSNLLAAMGHAVSFGPLILYGPTLCKILLDFKLTVNYIVPRKLFWAFLYHTISAGMVYCSLFLEFMLL